MREIEFRGKRLDNGKWHFGDLQLCCDERVQIWLRIDEHCSGGEYPNQFVITETVGQYTGLKDKNGLKIFEGDIVKMCNGDNLVCLWFDRFCQFILKTSPDSQVWVTGFPKSTEVIGNIHDNPELLTEMEKENGT